MLRRYESQVLGRSVSLLIGSHLLVKVGAKRRPGAAPEVLTLFSGELRREVDWVAIRAGDASCVVHDQ